MEPWELALKRPKWEIGSLMSLGGLTGTLGLQFGGYSRRILRLEDNKLMILNSSEASPNLT